MRSGRTRKKDRVVANTVPLVRLGQLYITALEAQRVAKNALNEAQAAAHKGGDDVKRVASYEGEMKTGQLQPTNEKGEVPDAENQMVKGDFTEAANELEDLAQDFPNKSPEEQKKIEQQKDRLGRRMIEFLTNIL